jgi:O-antigen/teichoic acid export membrane protein
VLAEIQTWVGLFAVLFGISINVAVYHFANRERYTFADGARLTLTLGSSLGTSLLAATAMGTFFLVWPEKVSSQAVEHLTVVVGLLVATLFATNLLALSQSLGHVRLTAAASICQALTNIGLIAPAFLLDIIDVRYALLSTLCVQTVGALAVLFVLWRAHGASLSGVTAQAVLAFFSVGLKQHIAAVALFGYVRVNQLIVFHYCGAHQTGLYAAAYGLSFGVFSGFGALQLALYPRVIHHSDDLQITTRSLRIGLYSGILIITPLILFAHTIMRAYAGSRFQEAEGIFQLLVPSAWFLSLSSLVAPYYIKSGAFGLGAIIAITLGCCSIVANFLLVPPFAGIGAAGATLVTTLLGFVLNLGLLRLISGVSPMSLFLPYFGQEITALKTALSSWTTAR